MLKVLVVDDEMPIRQWLEFCIRKMEGCEIVGTAAHGAEGFSLFRRNSPDVVITDIRMPVMDGLEMMKMIQAINPSVYVVILTSHEEFEYARKAMNLGAAEYILKTEISDASLQEILNKAAAALGKGRRANSEELYEGIGKRNHFLRSLVLNNQELQISEAMIVEYGIPLNHTPYYAVDIFRTPGDNVGIKLPDTDCFQQLIKIPLDDNHTMLVGNIAGCYLHSSSQSHKAVIAFAEKLIAQNSCYIGISDLADDPGSMVKRMIQAYHRVGKHFYHPKRYIFDVEDVSSRKPTNGEKYKILYNRELVNQNYAGAVEAKNKMVEEIRNEEPSDIAYVKELYLFFITTLFHMTMGDINKSEQQIAESRETVKACYFFEQLNKAADNVFEEYSCSTRKVAEYSYAVRYAVEYLKDHYAQPVTQAEVAEAAGISSEYLSRIFKEETGVNFIVYLNNLRLKHSLKLLETTNLKVYEVAEQVGYSSLSYFSIVFKKNFGLNPFEYKNKYLTYS